MSVKVRRVARLVGHFVGLLTECERSRGVLESWGVNVGRELELTDRVMTRLEELLGEGVEEI